MSPIPFLEVRTRGSCREIGRAVGEAARPLIADALAYYQEHFTEMSGIDFAKAREQATGYLAFARRYLPQYVEELEGMAEGSGQPFLDLMVPNCGEEFTCPIDTAPPRLSGDKDAAAEAGGDPQEGLRLQGAAPGCTGVAVCAGGRHVVGHNMDWYAVDVDKNVLFDVTGPDGTRFLTIAGVPYLPILGLNSHGVAYVGNSVYSADARLGVPNAFVRRWALDADSIDEARARATMPARARGSNHLWADRGGAVYDLETSATATASWRPFVVDGPPGASGGADRVACAHTNHYAAGEMERFEGSWAAESRDRLRRAEALLKEGLAHDEDPLGLVARVLRDHAGAPDAICGHVAGDPPPDRSITVASMICDLDEMCVHVCAGPPCSNPYRTYAF